jgi:drug/metabolite transporter (DMT)-like permease
MPTRSAVLLVVGTVAVGFAAIFIRLADAPSLSIAFYRNAIAAAILLPLAIARHPGELRRLSRRQAALLVLSGAFLAVHFATWISSLALTTVAASVVLVTAAPIFTVAAERVFFGQRASRRVLVGILLALVGTLVISGGALAVSGRAALGDLLALAGAVAGAGYFLAGQRLRPAVSLLTYSGVVYAICAVLLLVTVLIAGDPLGGFDAETWWMLLLLALVPQIVGHTTFNYLLADLDATVVTVAVMGEPVVSALLAVAFFGEVPSWSTIVGGLVLLAGIYVALTSRSRAAVEVRG